MLRKLNLSYFPNLSCAASSHLYLWDNGDNNVLVRKSLHSPLFLPIVIQAKLIVSPSLILLSPTISSQAMPAEVDLPQWRSHAKDHRHRRARISNCIEGKGRCYYVQSPSSNSVIRLPMPLAGHVEWGCWYCQHRTTVINIMRSSVWCASMTRLQSRKHRFW